MRDEVVRMPEPATEANGRGGPSFPPSNWGPAAALLGLVLAIGVGIFLGIPALVIDSPQPGEELSTGAAVAAQIATGIGFLFAPLYVARRRSSSLREALGRLGVRGFRPATAVRAILAAIGAYMLFAILYVLVAGAPEQEDIAEGFGAVPVQIALIIFVAPVSEEFCFRSMLFGGLRERMPKYGAALLSGVIFGALHAVSGISAVPPLIAFGTIMALLYERTGSILPAIFLHMLNNSVALLGQ